MKTVKELFLSGKRLLADFPECDLETRILLCLSVSITEEQFHAGNDREIPPDKEKEFFRLIGQRISGMPLAYITGHKEFWSIPFEVGPGVLIPRPESELIVEKVLEFVSGREPVIADIGTGCGNLAVALGKELPESRIFAVDASLKALEVARRNAAAQGLSNIRFAHGDRLFPLKRLGLQGNCDFIISNPPYVSEYDWKSLPLEIRGHEPKEALLAGKTGLEFIGALVSQAPEYLSPGGSLVFEIGWGQEGPVMAMFGAGWDRVRSYGDLSGIPRVVAAEKCPR